MASDWADEKARELFGRLCAIANTHPGSGPKVAVIRDFLDELLRIPADCVRLADGRVVKVLGALPMTADGCIIGTNADLYSWWVPQYTDDEGICPHSSTGPIVSAPHQCYSTSAAAEATRGEGSKNG